MPPLPTPMSILRLGEVINYELIYRSLLTASISPSKVLLFCSSEFF